VQLASFTGYFEMVELRITEMQAGVAARLHSRFHVERLGQGVLTKGEPAAEDAYSWLASSTPPDRVNRATFARCICTVLMTPLPPTPSFTEARVSGPMMAGAAAFEGR
jgi:hypothetical protein